MELTEEMCACERSQANGVPMMCTICEKDIQVMDAKHRELKAKRIEQQRESWIANVMRIYPDRTREEAEALHEKIFQLKSI